MTPGRFRATFRGMRPPITVRPATEADRPATAEVLARAFIADPAIGHIFPKADGKPARLSRFFGLMTRIDPDPGLWSLALDGGGAPVAAALWRRPGDWKTPTSTIVRNLPALLRVFGTALPRALGMQATLEAHHPHAPHWYLQFAGCVPAAQGKGFGGAAIRARLALLDAAGEPAALETATESNVGLYQSLGFAVTGTYRVRNGPMFWAMWREPQGG